jgi:cell division protein FtsB
MSAIIRTRRQKNLPGSTAVLWVVLGLAVVFFLFSYGQEVLLAHDLNQKAAAQRAANAVIRDENTRLRSLLQYYQSDKYIEQRAREDLNLRREEEEVLIPVLVTPESPPAMGSPDQAQAAQSGDALPSRAERANWQKWFDLFLPRPETRSP